ncbi:MAG: FadR/GntR family transcriptional regulator [Solirubrobacterales bacterium]
MAAEIRDGIFAGSFPSGEFLPTENDLATRFETSRTSVREALRALQAEGLVVPGGTAPVRAMVADALDRPARAALVNLFRLQRIGAADLNDVRSVLESAAMRRAAVLQLRDRMSEARRALSEMEEEGLSVVAFDEADVRFHVALVQASGNEAMHLIMLALRDPVAEQLLDALQERGNPEPVFRALAREHRAILEAVEEGDGEEAARLVDSHIRGFYAAEERDFSLPT